MREDLAIVGCSIRLPESENLEEMWKVLLSGREVISEIPESRQKWFQMADPQVYLPRRGGFLSDIDLFDPVLFGISSKEASDMDPAQRLALESAFRTFEDAGINPRKGSFRSTGVYFGNVWSEFQSLRAQLGLSATKNSLVGQSGDAISSRISFAFGFQGPSLTIMTGCSASLVALECAARAIEAGSIDQALVGGVNVILTSEATAGLTRFGGLSPDGRCRAFDARANGFVRSEGVGSVLVMPLARARKLGLKVRALVKAVCSNNDGGGESFHSPHVVAQASLISRCYEKAGVPLEEVDYIEAHGTGTKKGDPVEAESLSRAFRGRGSVLPIGSLKTNFGHFEGASGIAGLIKAVLICQKRVLPRSLHFEKPNDKIPFEKWGLTVVTETQHLQTDHVVVGVNSFGWGGTNAHAVVTSAPTETSITPLIKPLAQGFLLLSAPSAQHLEAWAEKVSAALEDPATDLQNLSHTLAEHTVHHRTRLAVPWILEEKEQLLRRLRAERLPAEVGCSSDSEVVFVFPGQGSQWAGMGHELYQKSEIFKECVDEFDRALIGFSGFRVQELLSASADESWLSDISRVQPALVCFMIATARLWQSSGVQPSAVIGHSMGEIAAACFAGAISISDAARLSVVRSQLMKRQQGLGSMLFVESAHTDLEPELNALKGRVERAAVNGPSSTLLSGDADAVEELRSILEARGIECRSVQVTVSSHSHHMEPLTEELQAFATKLRFSPFVIPMISSVTGEVLRDSELNGGYWARNLRNTVIYSQAVETAVSRGAKVFVEVSPHPVLVQPTRSILETLDVDAIAFGSFRRDEAGLEDWQKTLIQAWESGLNPEWGEIHQGLRCVAPAFPLLKSRFWLDDHSGLRGAGRSSFHPILGDFLPVSSAPSLRVSTFSLSTKALPWIEDHCIGGSVLVPMAAVIELMVSAAARATGCPLPELHHFSMKTSLPIDATETRAQIVFHHHVYKPCRLDLFLLDALSADCEPRLVAQAWVNPRASSSERLHLPFKPDERALETWADEAVYSTLSRSGYRYGQSFKGVETVCRSENFVWGEISMKGRALSSSFSFSPVSLDACLQTVLITLLGEKTWLPVSIETFKVMHPLEHAGRLFVTACVDRSGENVRADLQIFDHQGAVVAEVGNFRLIEASLGGNQHGLFTTLVSAERQEPEEIRCGSMPGTLVVYAHSCESGEEQGALAETLSLCDQRLASHASQTIFEGVLEGCSHLVFRIRAIDYPALSGLQKKLLDPLVVILQKVLKMQPLQRPHVWVVSDADPIDERSSTGSAVVGLLRSLYQEHPDLRTTVIQLDQTAAKSWFQILYTEQSSSQKNEHVIWRGRHRFVSQLEAASEHTLVQSLVNGLPDANEWSQYEVVRPGDLQSGRYLVTDRLQPGENMVEVSVQAVGLNYVDRLGAMGRTFNVGRTSHFRPGGEFSGVVTAVGRGVSEFRVGDEVIGAQFECLASHVTVHKSALHPKPGALSWEQAATLPLVYATAVFALMDRACLEEGQSVLIHSAAGGLGLAALHVARMLGLRVFATAGTPEKREYLKRRGVECVLDSRTGSFSDEIRRMTNGAGVDAVLNSLSGELMHLSLELVKEDGVFLECGKADIYDGRSIDLSSFQKAIQYAAIDLAGFQFRQPSRFQALIRRVLKHVESGHLPPLPVQTYRASEVQRALSQFASADHVGKIAVTFDRSEPVPLVRSPFSEDPEAVAIVTGGSGGLGQSLIRKLESQGVHKIVVIGRTPLESLPKPLTTEWSGLGKVTYLQADVSNEPELEHAIEAAEKMGRVRFVYHCAAILSDATFENLTPESTDRTFRPKVWGAWNLHRVMLKRRVKLSAFVMYSSLASEFGLAGQPAYCAANAALEGIHAHRLALGLCSSLFHFGPVRDVGLAAQKSNRGDRLIQCGLEGMSADEATHRMMMQLSKGIHRACVGGVDVSRWVQSHPQTVDSVRWKALAESAVCEAANENFADRIRNAKQSERLGLIQTALAEMIGKIVGIPGDAVSPDSPFAALGVDSLMKLEMRSRIEVLFGLKFQVALLFRYPTLLKLSEHLMNVFFPDQRCPGSREQKPRNKQERMSFSRIKTNAEDVSAEQSLEDLLKEIEEVLQ